MSAPRVSVILPVYNGAAFLAMSLRSVLNQKFNDFEVLVIDDASTDDSVSIAESFMDPRVRIIRHNRNMRLPAALNCGLDLARGEFIARMDADDLCVYERFERQVSFLDSHQDIGICGGWMRLFGGMADVTAKYPVSPDAVEVFRHFNCPFGHPTVMVRRDVLEANHLRYDASAAAVEDFELWNRLLKFTRGANLPEVLLEYRLHEASVTSRNWAIMDENSSKVLREALKAILPGVTEDEARFHRKVSMASISPDIDSLCKAEEWLGRIAPALDKNHDARSVLRDIWFRLAMKVAPSVGIASLHVALGGKFPRNYGLSFWQRMMIVGSATKAWVRGVQ